MSVPLPGVLLSGRNEKWLMSFFCSVVLGKGKSKLVSGCDQIALPQPVQSHCVQPEAVTVVGFSNALPYNAAFTESLID